ncbi:MAG: CPBP family intramembrane metalloprotease [Candidatus Eremiobacteraeota bacterium]|nr:CPBP family intramembrane metalloprotease [Candidatus Eremiobacteraeota bacterium]
MKRVIAFPLTRLVLIMLVFGGLTVPVVHAARPPYSLWQTLVANWTLALLLLAAMFSVEWVTVRKKAAQIGFDPSRAPRDIIVGFLFGALLISLVIAELAASGFYRIVQVHVTRELGFAAMLLLADAVLEETLFRGVLFRLVEEWAGTWIALVVSAALFGLAHAANPGATWFSSVAIALEAGVLLGAAFVVTRNLWFPIALHFAWNFFEGPVYGSQVSGHQFMTSVIIARINGPTIVTGGRFGPEAGLFALITCLVAAVVLLAYATRRSLIVPPFAGKRIR